MARIGHVARNVDFGQLFDSFFVTAISTILIIRFYLKVTGYPQIGSSTLHFSHLLPGTLLMLLSIFVLLATVNRSARNFSAITAGIGFGLAWDELGKFITKNNDYFFRATPGLIYLTFVVLYLLARYSAQRRFTEDDYMANVLDLIKDASINDLSKQEYDHANKLFAHVSPQHVLYEPTKQLLSRVKPTPHQPTTLGKIITHIKNPIRAITRQAFFPRLVIAVAIGYGVISIAAAAFFFAGAAIDDVRHLSTILRGDESDIIGGTSALISAFCAGLAAYFYFDGHRRKAYKLFELGLLVNIFIGQVVLFFKNESVALAWLALTVFLLVSLRVHNYSQA